jgi:hypothetical protein
MAVGSFECLCGNDDGYWTIQEHKDIYDDDEKFAKDYMEKVCFERNEW